MLDAHPSPKVIAAVHAETSTGVRSDLAELGANKGDALLLVDAVTSIGGIPLDSSENAMSVRDGVKSMREIEVNYQRNERLHSVVVRIEDAK